MSKYFRQEIEKMVNKARREAAARGEGRAKGSKFTPKAETFKFPKWSERLVFDRA